MPKYEIMLITDPKSSPEIVDKLATIAFGDDMTKVEKLDRTTLAYEINGSTTAFYFLINLTTKPENIKEFVRRVNLEKSVWRNLVINLDTERGTNPRVRKSFNRKPTTFSSNKNAVSSEQKSQSNE